MKRETIALEHGRVMEAELVKRCDGSRKERRKSWISEKRRS